jgi:hypothetical protein
MDELYWFLEYKPLIETRENICIITMVRPGAAADHRPCCEP